MLYLIMKSSKKFLRICNWCQKQFESYRWSIDSGYAKFCSHSCAIISRNTISIEIRFWSKVDKTDNCWNWTAGKNEKGYGLIKYKGKTVSTHRLSYILHYGEIPDNKCVLHSCDNRSCVRPDHLFIGTNQDNMTDMQKKNRAFRGTGELNGNAKLSNQQTLDLIKDFISNKKYGYKTFLAKKYNISITQVSYILRKNDIL